ncbi:FMN-dependent NADH-azoreductase [Kordiimonas laminariae]|uniref:FMN-dependent NADH-azoreductase n=1 Tax=Kordiimonas laminariae TaxID=2917717 RepID=UPI001FF3FE05|nr:NAD(P)H-dependent oxidoreductase [Kordiimonas laminariae]MCK0070602.1 NAD(P)H-dependent oxidoreductase [Kordiimonas laminariae]
MANILVIDSSARFERSLSRQLSDAFVKSWKDQYPDYVFTFRDVAKNPPPHVTEEWIAAAFTDEADRTDTQQKVLLTSDEITQEVLDADVIVISAPMYNYGMPSTLKAWVDQVVRIGKTFSFDLSRGAKPIEPIQTGKSMVILTSSGEGNFAALGLQDHLDVHMKSASHLMGVSHHHSIRIEFQEYGDEDKRFQNSHKAALANIPSVIEAVIGEQSI